MYKLNIFYTDDETNLPMRAQFTFDSLPEAFASAQEYVKVGASIVELLCEDTRYFYYDPSAPAPVL